MKWIIAAILSLSGSIFADQVNELVLSKADAGHPADVVYVLGSKVYSQPFYMIALSLGGKQREWMTTGFTGDASEARKHALNVFSKTSVSPKEKPALPEGFLYAEGPDGAVIDFIFITFADRPANQEEVSKVIEAYTQK